MLASRTPKALGRGALREMLASGSYSRGRSYPPQEAIIRPPACPGGFWSALAQRLPTDHGQPCTVKRRWNPVCTVYRAVSLFCTLHRARWSAEELRAARPSVRPPGCAPRCTVHVPPLGSLVRGREHGARCTVHRALEGGTRSTVHGGPCASQSSHGETWTVHRAQNPEVRFSILKKHIQYSCTLL